MKPEEIKNRKDTIIYFLQILNDKNRPLDLGEFFIDSGYSKGIEAFENIMEEIESKGWIIIKKIPSGSVPGMPYLRTNKVTYEISLSGIEFLESETKKKNETKIFSFSKKVFNYLKPYTKGIVITVVGGIILFYIISFISSDSIHNQTSKKIFHPPYLRLENYKIKAKNKTYPIIDTLKINAIFQGSKVVLIENIKIVDYNFIDSYLFFDDEDYNYKPELELLEVIIPIPVLDSINSKIEIMLEIKRKMIFDGTRMAWFNVEDKQKIGDITIMASFKYEEKIIRDTLNTNIYIEK